MTVGNPERLSERSLNRATLARQRLIEPLPAGTPVEAAVDAVGPLQAQYNPSPFLALRARVDGFATDELRQALDEYRVVKASLARSTLHIVSAAAHPELAAALAPSRVKVWRSYLGKAVDDIDRLEDDLLAFVGAGSRSHEEMVAFGESWLAEHIRPGASLPPTGNLFMVRSHPALLRTPETTRIDYHGRDRYLLASSVLGGAGSAADPEAAFGRVVGSYLAAFGPAATDDIQSFFGETRVTRVRAALTSLEPDVVKFADDGGRVLYDLLEGPRPAESVGVPTRLLPRFDSLLLAYAPKFRTRVLAQEHNQAVIKTVNGQVLPTVLVDGMVAGTWDLTRTKGAARLTIEPFRRLAKAGAAEVVVEAERVLAFLDPDASPEVVVARP